MLSRSLRQTFLRGLVSGSVASVTSTLALILRSRSEARTALSAQNAVSHWVWGDEAKERHELSVRHTLVGYGVHHASAVFWGILYERATPAAVQPPIRELGRAAAFAALANFVDYRLTPYRFKPGFERHLSKRSLLVVYGAFAVGLAIGHRLQRPDQNAQEAGTAGPGQPVAVTDRRPRLPG